MPEGWAWARLTSILEVFITGPFGSSLHKSDYVDGGTPLINPMNIVDGKIEPNAKMLVSSDTVKRLSSFAVQPADIVIARRGEMGRCAVVTDSESGWLCGTGSFVLRLINTIDASFIVRYISSPNAIIYLAGNSIGNTMPNLNQAILRSMLIPTPPFKEQLRIVQQLCKTDMLIDKVARHQSALADLIISVKSKILNLAIRGQLVPQDPADEPASVLLERIRTEKESLIKQGKIKRDKKESVIFRGDDNSYYEKIGGEVRCIDEILPFEIPEDWAWCRGYSCFEGMASVKPQGELFDYIDIDAIDNQNHRIKEAKRLPVAQAPSRASRAVQRGSVLFSLVRPYLENIALVDEEHSHCIASTGFFVCNSNGAFLPEFMFFMMISRYVVSGLNQYMKGDNSPSISKDSIEDWLYPVPPLEEQRVICCKLRNTFSAIERIEKSLS